MKRVKLLDSAWLLLEKPETPMHVGILMRFSAPPEAKPDYIHGVVAALRASTHAESPWDLILPAQRLRGFIPIWLHECYLDMEHHVQLHRLAGAVLQDPQDALGKLLSTLHGQPLDRSRPLWECHVIAGFPDSGFALYVKVHHAVLDGVGGLRLMQKLLAHSPETRDQPSPWSSSAQERDPRSVARLRPPRRGPVAANGMAEAPAGVMTHLGRAGRELLRSAIGHADQLVTPYRAPASPFNQRVTARRGFVQQRCEMVRIKRLAQLCEMSCNDIVLGVCAGALQRLLVEMDAHSAPLTAAVPVSTRPRHGDRFGTALSFCLANLGTDIRDPHTRLRAIHASTRRAKEHLGCLPRAALTPYTSTLMLPFLMEQVTRFGGRMRPMFNVVISNVPGPKAPLYLEGARLESVYPLSVLFHGQGLNITCIRYLDEFSFGFTACPDVVPLLDRLPAFTQEALEELETEFSFPHRVAVQRRTEPVARPVAMAAAQQAQPLS
jgi:diacylglycerol O-acyltransferase / wax synthase